MNKWFCSDFVNDRISDDIRIALNVGTTLTTRLWVSLFSFVLATQLSFDQPSLFSYAAYSALMDTVPAPWWVGALYISSGLMAWRVLAPVSRPHWGWASNLFTTCTWSLLVLSRVALIGYSAVIGFPTVVLIMSIWLTIRTEATNRDQETA